MDAEPNIGLLIEEVIPSKGGKSESLRYIICSSRHHLHQANRTHPRHSLPIVLTLLSNDRRHQIGVDTARAQALDRGKESCRIGHLPERRFDNTAGSLQFISEPGPRESERMVIGTNLVQHRRKRHEDIGVSVIAIGQPSQFMRSIQV